MLTYSQTVDAIGAPEQIVAQSVCKKIVIYENAQAGTLDYIWRAPNAASPAVTRPAGSKTEFAAPGGAWFKPGDIVAYVETVSGSFVLVQEES